MKKILVTGCNGQLGRAIQKEYAGEVEFVLTDVVDGDGYVSLDITKIDDVMDLVKKEKPDVIINCAAHTNVDKCEEQWDLAFRINAIGPRNLAIAAKAVDAKLVHVSTDYVFPGTSPEALKEIDPVGPKSAYGKTKLEGENFVKQFGDKYFILRTAWLYGDGHNFVKTMLKLSETHDELSVVCDQIGSPTSASELARMIHYLEPTDNYGIFHATCEGQTSWAEFTEEIYRLAKVKTKVKHVTSAEYKAMNPASADRPAFSVLENYMIKQTSDFMMADWHDAIKEYMENLNA